MVAGKGAIDPFAKRLGGLARANGRSHAVGVVLPPRCGGGGVVQRLHQYPGQHGVNLGQLLGYFGPRILGPRILSDGIRERSRQAIRRYRWC